MSDHTYSSDQRGEKCVKRKYREISSLPKFQYPLDSEDISDHTYSSVGKKRRRVKGLFKKRIKVLLPKSILASSDHSTRENIKLQRVLTLQGRIKLKEVPSKVLRKQQRDAKNTLLGSEVAKKRKSLADKDIGTSETVPCTNKVPKLCPSIEPVLCSNKEPVSHSGKESIPWTSKVPCSNNDPMPCSSKEVLPGVANHLKTTRCRGKFRRTCVMPGCFVNSIDNPNLALFDFPRVFKRNKIWADFAGEPTIPGRLVRKYMCVRHFERGQLANKYGKKLIPGGVPSIRYPDDTLPEPEPEPEVDPCISTEIPDVPLSSLEIETSVPDGTNDISTNIAAEDDFELDLITHSPVPSPSPTSSVSSPLTVESLQSCTPMCSSTPLEALDGPSLCTCYDQRKIQFILKATKCKRRTCVMPGCFVNTIDNPNLTLFEFPRILERNKIWADFAGEATVPGRVVRRYMCVRHFERGQLTNKYGKRLLPGAVPSIRYPDDDTFPEPEPEVDPCISTEISDIPLPSLEIEISVSDVTTDISTNTAVKEVSEFDPVAPTPIPSPSSPISVSSPLTDEPLQSCTVMSSSIPPKPPEGQLLCTIDDESAQQLILATKCKRRTCVMPGCFVNTIDNPDLTLFDFPRSIKRNKIWADFAGEPTIPGRLVHKCMCVKHFKRGQLANKYGKKLIPGGVPSIRYPDDTLPEPEPEIDPCISTAIPDIPISSLEIETSVSHGTNDISTNTAAKEDAKLDQIAPSPVPSPSSPVNVSSPLTVESLQSCTVMSSSTPLEGLDGPSLCICYDQSALQFIPRKATKCKRRTCVMPGCFVNTIDNPNMTLFEFPRSLERNKIWADFAGEATVPGQVVRRYMCVRHFERGQLANKYGKKLIPGGVPSIRYPDDNLPEPEPEVDPCISTEISDFPLPSLEIEISVSDVTTDISTNSAVNEVSEFDPVAPTPIPSPSSPISVSSPLTDEPLQSCTSLSSNTLFEVLDGSSLCTFNDESALQLISRKGKKFRRTCVMPGCFVNSIDNPDLSLFNFPTVLERNKLWADFAGEATVPGRLLRKYMCVKHFERGQLANIYGRRLIPGAVPSIPYPDDNLPGTSPNPIVSRVMSKHSFSSTERETCVPDDLTSLFTNTLANEYSELDSVTPSPVPSPSPPTPTVNTLQFSTQRSSKSLSETLEGHSLCTFNDQSTPQLTPRKKMLNNNCRRLELFLKRLKCKFDGSKFKINEFEDSYYKSLNSFNRLTKPLSLTMVKLLYSKIHCCKLKPIGHWWTREEKLRALSLSKRSPKVYTLLRSIFPLPCERSLNNLLHSIPCTPGINQGIFTSLSRSLKSYDDLDRTCCLMFCEMPVRELVRYDNHSDIILGCEDMGGKGRSTALADRVLIFMIKGLRRSFKQPVAFYFISGRIKSENLVEIIWEILGACKNAGLDIVATVCDMGATNAQALKFMGARISKPWLTFEGKEVVTIFDPSHLLKNTRNMLQKYDILTTVEIGSCTGGRAKWEHIVQIYDKDKKLGSFRRLCKLTDDHINPDRHKAMQVNLAAQVFSHTMATTLYSLVSTGERPDVQPTALVVKLMNNLFDSLNSLTVKQSGAHRYRSVVCREREKFHLDFWKEAAITIQKWKFIDKKEKEPGKAFHIPLQTGWITTINGIQHLWEMLKEKGFSFLETRSLSGDSLEHLIESIQSHCGGITDPTAWQFKAALKTCVLNGLPVRDIKDMKYEKPLKSEEVLSNLNEFLEMEEAVNTSQKVFPSAVLGSGHTSFENHCFIVGRSVNKVSWFIAQRVLTWNSCVNCRRALVTNEAAHGYHSSIHLGKSSGSSRVVKSPTSNMVKTIAASATLLMRMLPNIYHESFICQKCVIALRSNINMDWIGQTCSLHCVTLREKIIKLCCRIYVVYWCTKLNQARRI